MSYFLNIYFKSWDKKKGLHIFRKIYFCNTFNWTKLQYCYKKEGCNRRKINVLQYLEYGKSISKFDFSTCSYWNGTRWPCKFLRAFYIRGHEPWGPLLGCDLFATGPWVGIHARSLTHASGGPVCSWAVCHYNINFLSIGCRKKNPSLP